MINRPFFLNLINKSFDIYRIVCLLGPRQCGKTTLARTFRKENKEVHYFDLEKPADFEALQNPDLLLPQLTGLIIIDEVQLCPKLFSYLRYLHDEEKKQRFLLLGSASRSVIQKSGESLAGRIGYVDISPFCIFEVENMDDLWTRGGFPKSYLLKMEQSLLWRQNYMRTYIEQDLRHFGMQADLVRKLWFMLAHYHGQTINYSELAKSMGVSQPTITKYVQLLSDCFMVRLLKPWHANLKKRQVKNPKFYYTDQGLLHYVLGIKSYPEILLHPKSGASFEGFAIEQIIKIHQADDCYFWATHNKAELDLLIIKNGRRIGFEFKLSDSPKITPSMRIAYEDLNLDELNVIYPKGRSYPLSDLITVSSLADYISKNNNSSSLEGEV